MDSFTKLLEAALGKESVQTTTALDGTVLFWYAADLSVDLINGYTINPVVSVSRLICNTSLESLTIRRLRQ